MSAKALCSIMAHGVALVARKCKVRLQLCKLHKKIGHELSTFASRAAKNAKSKAGTMQVAPHYYKTNTLQREIGENHVKTQDPAIDLCFQSAQKYEKSKAATMQVAPHYYKTNILQLEI